MDSTGDPVRVLLVDDDEDVAATAASFLELERDHVEVVTAPDASEGLDVLAGQRIDCVVSDYEMPGTDGLDFLDRVREEYGELPFVLFTGRGSEALASEAIAAGVTDYVRKAAGTDQYALLANRIDRAVEAHRSQSLLADRTRRLETLISNLPGIVYRCGNDPDWPMEFVAGECERLTGYSAAALEGGDVSWGEDVLHPDDRAAAWEAVQDALDADEPFEVTYRIHTCDGETRWMWERGRALYTDGDLDALEGFITDVTARREREHRIEGLQRRTRELIDTTTRAETAQVAVDAAHEVLGAELSGCHLLSDDGETLEPVAVVDTVCETLGGPPAYDRTDEGPACELVWDAFERGESVVVDDAREHGRLAEVTPARSGVVHPLADHGVFIVSATEPGAFDDTDIALVEIIAASLTAALDRVERELRLREREDALETERDRLRALFEMVPDPITHVRFEDGEPVLLDVNAAFEETFGYETADAVGESCNDLIVPPARREAATRIDQQARDGQTVTQAVRRRTADGVGDFLFRSIPVGDPDDTDEYYGIYVDISEQKATERQLERQNERLEEFAELLSHDLRNPLNVAQGRVELLQDRYDSEHLDAAMAAHERMTALIEDILYLAREGGTIGAVEPVDVAETARGCWGNVETDDARLVVDTDRSVLADRGQFQRLLENLLGNAVEHGSTSPPSQAPEDAVEHSSTSPASQAQQNAGSASASEPSVADAPEDAVEHGSMSPPSQAPEDATGRDESTLTVTVGHLEDGFYVADDGTGFDAEARGRLFETGYSTSPEGTGFGLRIVERVADGHGWDVTATDSDAGGARFEVTGVETPSDAD
jgi:PAS domain S-box-containing protein